jgi:hypothetical protein
MAFKDQILSRDLQLRSADAIENALELIECGDIGMSPALSFVLSALWEFGKFSIFAVALSSTFPIRGLYKGQEITIYEESSSTQKRFFRWADYLSTSCRL